MCVKFNLPPFCLLLEGIEIHCFIRLHSEFPLVHLPFSRWFSSLQVATLIVPWPSLSSSQAVEEVPPDICQGFVRSKVTRGHPGKDGKVLLGRSCHVFVTYWGQITGVSFFMQFHGKTMGDEGFKTQRKHTVIFQESCYIYIYTLIFERQKTQHAHNDFDLNKSQLRS